MIISLLTPCCNLLTDAQQNGWPNIITTQFPLVWSNWLIIHFPRVSVLLCLKLSIWMQICRALHWICLLLRIEVISRKMMNYTQTPQSIRLFMNYLHVQWKSCMVHELFGRIFQIFHQNQTNQFQMNRKKNCQRIVELSVGKIGLKHSIVALQIHLIMCSAECVCVQNRRHT